ncbi:hypothetical protein HS088_TW23G00036 [Tripterygium wilfordii]|uniref:Uncharacterized protein n=1 Tax=Tripterygium wilfordii TaxID=458696 RepID=A0A7J7BUD4_TRIWF|nr:hypothetical protein HS088_TW23G00036 [Tripterygium wilfordii]
MGNIIASFFSGLAKVIGDLFGSPLDFFKGKSCNSVCRSTWDFICYIENFCVANLLKMAMVFALLYIVLLFLYLLQKLGICQCVGWSLCKFLWACLASWFSIWEYCCTFLLVKVLRLKRRNRERRQSNFEEFDTSTEEDLYDESFSSRVPRRELSSLQSRRLRDYKRVHLRRSLRPRSHRIQVGISTDSKYGSRRNSFRPSNHVHSIRVTQTSKFVRKGPNYSSRVGGYRRRRR